MHHFRPKLCGNVFKYLCSLVCLIDLLFVDRTVASALNSLAAIACQDLATGLLGIRLPEHKGATVSLLILFSISIPRPLNKRCNYFNVEFISFVNKECIQSQYPKELKQKVF